ncbi:MAG TPA: hypothetical protein VFC02_13015 [Anaerolineales bacterium]|nr:hypothetical protein [Anaerolineales bacterium]
MANQGSYIEHSIQMQLFGIPIPEAGGGPPSMSQTSIPADLHEPIVEPRPVNHSAKNKAPDHIPKPPGQRVISTVIDDFSSHSILWYGIGAVAISWFLLNWRHRA